MRTNASAVVFGEEGKQEEEYQVFRSVWRMLVMQIMFLLSILFSAMVMITLDVVGDEKAISGLVLLVLLIIGMMIWAFLSWLINAYQPTLTLHAKGFDYHLTVFRNGSVSWEHVKGISINCLEKSLKISINIINPKTHQVKKQKTLVVYWWTMNRNLQEILNTFCEYKKTYDQQKKEKEAA